MQRKFYEDNKLEFEGFRFPSDKNADLSEMVRDKKVPQADTVVLYSCGMLANKGRKRFKRTGQTSSIYMSESLGGKQVGTLVSTVAVKQGPVFYDSIPNQKAETIFPVLGKYVPVHNPLFTDEGYRGYPGMNHRMVNHSRKSSDKRYKWARNRWSRNGVHCNVAEGKNGILKRSFSSYVWINPRYSNLYLQEYAFNANLRYFGLEQLAPEGDGGPEQPSYRLDDNWAMRKMFTRMIHTGKPVLKQRLAPLVYEAKSLPELNREASRDKLSEIENLLSKIENQEVALKLRQAHVSLQEWYKSKPTQDQRKKQRYYEVLANKVWPLIPEYGFVEIHEVAAQAKISGKHVYRLLGIWTQLGLLETVDLNKPTKGKVKEYFDVRRTSPVLLPVRYTVEKHLIPEFNKNWRAATSRMLKKYRARCRRRDFVPKSLAKRPSPCYGEGLSAAALGFNILLYGCFSTAC